MWRHTCAKMAETGTEAGTDAGIQRAAAPHEASETPEFKWTIAVPIWKKELLRSVQGNAEKEGKHPTLLKGDWNLISSTANLYFSTLMAVCASQQTISYKVLEEAT